MTVQEIIQKIEAAAQRNRLLHPRVTENLLKFEMINFQTETFWQSSAISSRNGYYAMQGDTPIFFASSSWTTYKLPIATAIPTLCTYTGLVIGNILFAIHRNDGSIEYVPISSAETVSFQLPENTEALEVSVYLSGMITAKVEVERRQYADITPYVQNWPTINMTQTRKDFSGVTLDVTSQIEVSGLAADIMKALVEENSLYARVGFNIYKRQDRTNNYDLLRGFEVDFLTYVEYDDHVEFQSIKNDLQEYVKSGLSTKFDFPVSSLTDAKKWDYDRMVLLNSVNYTMGTDTVIDNPNPIGGPMFLPVSYSNSELVQNDRNATLDFKSQPFSHFDTSPNQYFFKTGADLSCTLNMKFKIKLDIHEGTANPGTLKIVVSAWREVSGGHQVVDLWNSPGAILGTGSNNIEIEVDVSIEIDLKANDIIYLHTSGGTNRIIYNIEYTEFEYFNLQWTDRGKSIIGIDLIRPERLLQRFLDSISGVINKFIANIEWSELSTIMLCAGETIRGFENATLHGSLKDFIEWISVLGYQYSYEGNTMTFRFTPEYYKKDIVSMELSQDEVSNMRIEANDEVAYTSIEIGYKKQDYGESANGIFETNTQFNYSTGYRNQTENVLSLMSPYRSDSIGAELLFWKRGELIKDNSSDNDIFALEMIETETNFVYSTLFTIRTEFPDIILYNALLNPHYLAIRNRFIIGIITNTIQFTATDGYRHATIGGDNIMYSDISIDPLQKLYEPLNYRIDVGSHLDMPVGSAMNGLIYFDYKGTIRKGFIQEITKECQEKQGEWLLSMVK